MKLIAAITVMLFSINTFATIICGPELAKEIKKITFIADKNGDLNRYRMSIASGKYEDMGWGGCFDKARDQKNIDAKKTFTLSIEQLEPPCEFAINLKSDRTKACSCKLESKGKIKCFEYQSREKY